MEFASWLAAWLKRHPLKEPDGYERIRYTDEVMARVRRLAHPVPVPARAAWPWPRVAVAFAAAAASLVLAFGALRHHAAGPAATPMVLAERQDDDATWLEQTMQLLNELDEQIDESSDSASGEEWIDDLELLDDSDFAASS
ncbi:MAG: hypothetical protein HY737_01665 [Candidatus Omnitrophica bacterium]|nr:hypothetical protein [Candidatus Omnitrophota bacterium]